MSTIAKAQRRGSHQVGGEKQEEGSSSVFPFLNPALKSINSAPIIYFFSFRDANKLKSDYVFVSVGV